jgi:predicted metal-dependent phosphoesterase TrpH
MIEQARRRGMDGLAFTEHNFAWDPEKVEMLRQRHDFLVLTGAEVDTDAGHVIVFGLQGPRRWLRLPDAQTLRSEVDAAGGVMILAHPFQHVTSIGWEASDEEWKRLIEERHWDVMDAIEVHNGKMSSGHVRLAANLARRLNLPPTGGSDAHRLVEVARSFTMFEDAVRDEHDVIAAIKSNRCRSADWPSKSVPAEGPQSISKE